MALRSALPFLLLSCALISLRSSAKTPAESCDPNSWDPPQFFPTEANTVDMKNHPFTCKNLWHTEPFQPELAHTHNAGIGFQGSVCDRLEHIPGGVFRHQAGGKKMHGMGFARCPKLKSWSPDAWTGLELLGRLHITECNITTIKARTLTNMAKLQVFDVQFNPIEVWEKGWSEGLKANCLVLSKANSPVKAPKSWCEKKQGGDKLTCTCAPGMVGADEDPPYCEWDTKASHTEL